MNAGPRNSNVLRLRGREIWPSLRSAKSGGLERSTEYPCEYCVCCNFFESVLVLTKCHGCVHSSRPFVFRDISRLGPGRSLL
jgi:hypothetical protein